MRRFAVILTATPVVAVAVWAVTAAYAVPPSAGESSSTENAAGKANAAQPAPTLDEARARARLLHETIHGALQVVHRDFYREGEKLPLPSRSLEDVFAEMARTHGVRIRWMAVNAQAMNVDHEPKDEFEKQAVAALAAGREEFGAVEDGKYRHVGSVRLASECLGCHVPSRSSRQDRVAALVINMPFGTD